MIQLGVGLSRVESHGPARHPYNANKNNDNFDKAIKVKKINNIKRNVPRSCFFAFSIGPKMVAMMMMIPSYLINTFPR